MTENGSGGPAHGSTDWKDACRHWHCTAVEGLIGERLEVKEDDQHAAHSPEEVLAWMEGEIERLRPALAQRRPGDSGGLTLDEELRELQLGRLATGRSAGTFVHLSNDRIVALDAMAVGPDCARHPVSC